MSIFEAGMLLCFGFAWPVNIYTSIKTRATAGKNPLFLAIIILGYAFGIANKIVHGADFVTLLYCINLVMVGVDLILYYRNLHLKQSKK
ncbi:MAG: hypothetical protein RR951_01270 [Ruthenibacterium sp.]